MTNVSEAALEQIRRLGQARSRQPANSTRHRQLGEAIEIEADRYRKALDGEQAAEQFDPRPRLVPGLATTTAMRPARSRAAGNGAAATASRAQPIRLRPSPSST
jgi:hypothetical protein